ncbi:hypothetical protein HYFRA_00013273 [Hymenoscyphus fraxineus]|uniref:SET domain-containing protein n=1 Tax=Hymenoscyphus fraxineus TaxID=746836 RepID=A0A9N9LBQ2_9HELO|nr:hypothetical protein HYFRA_00013273 [Hymenoscyphus fraxineus]
MPPKKKTASVPVPLARVSRPTGEHDLGDGLVANRMIPAGTRIILEEPALICKTRILLLPQNQAIEDRLKVEFNEFDAATKERVNALTNNFPSKDIGNFGEKVYIDTHYSGIFKSNAIPLSPDPSNEHSDSVGLFPVFLCKVNHSCRPNSMQSFNSKMNVATLHAIEDINAGDQITISYVPECKYDRKYLWKYYRINCYCSWCRILDREDEQQLELFHESNENHEIIQRKLRIHTKLASKAHELDKETLGAAFKIGRGLLIMITRIEDVSDYRLGQFYYNMFLLAIADKDSSKGAIEFFAALAWDAYRTCEGTDASKIPEIMKFMQKNVLQIPRGAPPMTPLDWHEQINQTLVDLVQQYEHHGEQEVSSELYREAIWPAGDLIDEEDEDDDHDSDDGGNPDDQPPPPGQLMVTEWIWFTKEVDSQAGDTTDEDEPSAKERAKNDGFVVSDDDSNDSNSEWGSRDEEALIALSAKKKKMMRKKAKKEGNPMRGRGRPRGGRASIRGRGTGRGTGRGRGGGGGRGRGSSRGRPSLGRGRGTDSGTPSGRPRGRPRKSVSNEVEEDIEAADDVDSGDDAEAAEDIEPNSEVQDADSVEDDDGGQVVVIED